MLLAEEGRPTSGMPSYGVPVRAWHLLVGWGLMATRRCDWGDAFERMRAYIDATMHERCVEHQRDTHRRADEKGASDLGDAVVEDGREHDAHEDGRDAPDDAAGEELVGSLPLGRGVEVLHVRMHPDERIVPDACRNDEAEPSEGEGEECQVALPAHAACSLTC